MTLKSGLNPLERLLIKEVVEFYPELAWLALEFSIWEVILVQG